MTHKPLRIFALICWSLAQIALAVDPWSPGEKPASARLTEHGIFSSQLAPTWLEQLTQPIRRGEMRFESAASCAATACHGGPSAGIAPDRAVRGAEYSLWIENDPHARSWRTLCSDTSVEIMERLNIMRQGEVVDRFAFDNCLACHNTARSNIAPSDEQDHQGKFHAEGVGCASCHGASGYWRKDHYRVALDDASSARVGRIPNKNLLARARTCAACHIGDQDRDMNHDIIASGHPALHYEFATFHNMLPKHWREPEKSEAADFEAQLWLAGQIAALDASLALLEARAAKQLAVSTWPEFAASACSSCHQSLRLGKEESTGVHTTQAASFSNWNGFGVEQLLQLNRLDGRLTGNDQQLAAALERLSKRMSARAIPDAAGVQNAARDARLTLDRWLTQTPARVFDQFSCDRLMQLAATSLRNELRLDSWEYAAQAYLAAVAARHAWLPQEQSPVLEEARRLRQGLLFKPGSKSLAPLDDSQLKIREIATKMAGLLDNLSLPPPRVPQENQPEFPASPRVDSRNPLKP